MRYRKAVQYTTISVLAYVLLVIAFESLLGYFQPEAGSTQLITTFDAGGAPQERVVARLESDGSLYVAANHWPRAWYRQALETPRMEVSYAGSSRMYRVIPIAGDSAEYERVDSEHSLGLLFRILTGFPPRRLLRLEAI